MRWLISVGSNLQQGNSVHCPLPAARCYEPDFVNNQTSSAVNNTSGNIGLVAEKWNAQEWLPKVQRLLGGR